MPATPVASLTIADGTAFVFRDWDVTDVVNGWLSGSYANYGLWIEEVPVQGNGTAFFHSSDAAEATHRPRLTMGLQAVGNQVPEPGSMALAGIALLAACGARRYRS